MICFHPVVVSSLASKNIVYALLVMHRLSSNDKPCPAPNLFFFHIKRKINLKSLCFVLPWLSSTNRDGHRQWALSGNEDMQSTEEFWLSWTVHFITYIQSWHQKVRLPTLVQVLDLIKRRVFSTFCFWKTKTGLHLPFVLDSKVSLKTYSSFCPSQGRSHSRSPALIDIHPDQVWGRIRTYAATTGISNMFTTLLVISVLAS
jgi:hypothetical protein